MSALRPRPAVTADTEFFWQGARRHELLVQRCDACRVLRHPPTAACAHCGSLDWTVTPSEGRGRLFSFTVLHEPLSPPFTAPHIGGIVELDEGVRLASELVGIDPADVEIGMPLRCDWLDDGSYNDVLSLPRFRPA